MIQEYAGIALESLDDEIVGLDEQERLINDLVAEFISSEKGQCCILEGKPGCGRQSLLDKILKAYDIELRIINVGQLAVDGSIQETLAKEEDGGSWKKTTRLPWLIFLSVTPQDFLEHMEKCGSSRMPRIRIVFENDFDFEEYRQAFKSLMAPRETEAASSPEYQEFLESLRPEKWLRSLHETYDLCVLKQVVAIILQRIVDCEPEDFCKEEVESAIRDAVEFASPDYEPKLKLLEDLSLRQQCVFLCAHRLLRNRPAESATTVAQITYRYIFLEYKKLVNTFYRALAVSSDSWIFREIDHLVEIGLLRADRFSNVTNMSFRKVNLGVDPLRIEKFAQTLKLPTAIADFFTSTRT
ncbi:unnamed protein product [Caenorhabditis auriculariae]|uniref:Uncharacterized protein n=1 Tax=Caenorhabditis auriculariae TaxID=2777116 RepID=A0A8S1HVG8_9PELO|nr:unnamed protein product [Caenorhabditis auriculariae]